MDTKIIIFSVCSLLVLIGLEQILYHHDIYSMNSTKNARHMTNFWFLVVRYVIDWGFGSYPNYIAILLYSAILNQRHRAYLHVVLYITVLYLAWTMQLIYAQPLYFNMYPNVFLHNTEYQILSCKFKFGLPSVHAMQYMALFVFVFIDYALVCKEINQTPTKVLHTKSVLILVFSLGFILLNGIMRIS
jgi:hypothetical protein